MKFDYNKLPIIIERLNNCILQKISASEDGFFMLNVYKPGDNRSHVVISIKKNNPLISLETTKITSSPKPNSFAQIARKYLEGRKINNIQVSEQEQTLFIEFNKVSAHVSNSAELNDGADCLIFVFNHYEPKLIVAKKYLILQNINDLNKKNDYLYRYINVLLDYKKNDLFYESYIEWTLDITKTKKRAFSEHRIIFSDIKINTNDIIINSEKIIKNTTTIKINNNDNVMTVAKAFSLLPSHVRKIAKTKLQFFERRLQRQKQDLPSDDEIIKLKKQAKALQVNLYMWPKNSLNWQVPEALVEEFNFNKVLYLKNAQKPGDLLNDYFREIEKLERRKIELTTRIAENEKTFTNFTSLLISTGEYIEQEFLKYTIDINHNNIEILLAKMNTESIGKICHICEVSWNTSEQKNKLLKQETAKKQPYRNFISSTGEFIRVAKSAADAEDMLKLMPSNHYWLHIATGEGSHVWLEKPKKAEPTAIAWREACIIAAHYSKQGKGLSAEIRFARGTDIEKKKDLAIGKVLIRRSETTIVRYTEEEINSLLK